MKSKALLGVIVASLLVPAAAAAQEATATSTAAAPATGFFLTGRLGMVNTAGLDGLAGGLGGPPPLVLGLDTGSMTIGIGPAYHNLSQKNDDADATSVGMLGLNVVATFRVAEAASGRAQLYPLVGLGTAIGFTSEDVGLDSSLFIQAQIGGGMRYFIAPNCALHVEIGEGLSRLSLSDGGFTSTTSVLTTWGNLGLSIVFGS